MSLAILVAFLPVSGALTLSKVFYLRDLSYCFWDRHIWLRRRLFSGEWPLWDPYLAAGQSAAADALHQMFLLPVLAVRLLGSEVVGFNLWVALPYPLAALGVYVLLRSRHTPASAALGAIAFAASGPVVSTGSFPNMSWSVAAMPWVLLAADRCEGPRIGRRISALALAVAFQGTAGEPVTMAATSALALAMSVAVGTRGGQPAGWRTRGASVLAVAGGLTLGTVIAAVQLLPMAHAAGHSARPFLPFKDFWSLHPLSLVEVIAPRIFGDYFQTSMLGEAPWLGALNSGRDPFFYSVYIGVPALSLAGVGAVAGACRRWSWFWAATGLIGLIAAVGGHTPVYPFLREYVPLLGSFRFPVKYLVISVMAVSVLASSGWDALVTLARQPAGSARRRKALRVAVLLPLSLGLLATVGWVAVQTASVATARWFAGLAASIGVESPADAATHVMRTIDHGLWKVALLSAGAAALLAAAFSRRPAARPMRAALFGLVVLDLLRAAWGLNPTCPVALLEPPSWAQVVKAHPESRFYLGGKAEGGIIVSDPDSPSRFVLPQMLPPMVFRAVLARHTLLYPAGVGAHEMLSYDQPVLWPRVFQVVQGRFAGEGAEGRARFLSRTAVRYRVLPVSKGGGRPATATDAFEGVRMFDFGDRHTRAFVVPDAVVVSSYDTQLDALFGASFDDRRSAMLARKAGPADGLASAPVEPFARFVEDHANRVTIDAGAGPAGGYLVLLDSYAPDWEVTVDGAAGTLYRANLLFRAVRLAPGRHTVAFRYRPQMVLAGAAFSAVGLLGALLISLRAGRSTRS